MREPYLPGRLPACLSPSLAHPSPARLCDPVPSDTMLCSKSDPMAVLYQSATSSTKSGQWLELGRTDVLGNTQGERTRRAG